MVELLATVEK